MYSSHTIYHLNNWITVMNSVPMKDGTVITQDQIPIHDQKKFLLAQINMQWRFRNLDAKDQLSIRSIIQTHHNHLLVNFDYYVIQHTTHSL